MMIERHNVRCYFVLNIRDDRFACILWEMEELTSAFTVMSCVLVLLELSVFNQ